MYWVWTLSTIWWAVIALGIVVNSYRSSGALSCVLFYFQMSSLASSFDESQNASGSNWAVIFSQFDTIFSLSSLSCWAPNMSAYDVTATKLIGPCFVLAFAFAWTRLLLVSKTRLLRRGIDLEVSYTGTFSVTLLFVFSNVTNVVFTLVTCTSEGVLFIDGSMNCRNTTWWILIGVVVILCLVPIVFAVSLWLNKLPLQARAAVCCAYTDSVYYWGSSTLAFRLLMSITPLLIPPDLVNISAFLHSLLSVLMLVLLMHQRPYVVVHTFWVDVSC
jgi:hypothetical protein